MTVNSICNRLLGEFGTLGAVLACSREQIDRLIPDAPSTATKIKRFHEAMLHSLRTDLSSREAMRDLPAVLRLIKARIGHAPTEQMLILFLDSRSRLIRDEIGAQGSVSRIDLEPSYVLRRALDLSATAIIIAHNHPSGDPALSRADRSYTIRLAEACRWIGVKLLDHIVVASGGHSSSREQGLL